MTHTPNTLDLDGDDCIDLALDLEKAFDFKFAPGEAEAVRNVGDLFEVLKNRFATGYDANRRCATAMTFYRLRRALSEEGRDITPSTELSGLVGRSPKLWLRRLSKQSGLALQPMTLTWAGVTGLLICGLSILLLIPKVSFHFSGLWLVAVFFLGVALLWLDPGRLLFGIRTVGDLARHGAARNFGSLARQGARVGDDEIWTALVDLLAARSRLPRQDIGRDTLFVREERKAA